MMTMLPAYRPKGIKVKRKTSSTVMPLIEHQRALFNSQTDGMVGKEKWGTMNAARLQAL